MKVVHVEARLKSGVALPDSFIEKLPKKVAVFTTIQLMSSLEGILKQIIDSGREAVVFKTGHTRHKGQILGCNVQTWDDYADESFDAFVYVGDGLFHPKALLWKNEDKTVYAFNPFTDKEFILDKKEMEMVKKRHMASLSKFYVSKRIGVIVTTKPGQMLLKRALELKEEYPEKEFYFFLDNTYNFGALEDFPFVEVWINTACPRIGFDDSIKISKPIINLEEVKKNNPRRALIR